MGRALSQAQLMYCFLSHSASIFLPDNAELLHSSSHRNNNNNNISTYPVKLHVVCIFINMDYHNIAQLNYYQRMLLVLNIFKRLIIAFGYLEYSKVRFRCLRAGITFALQVEICFTLPYNQTIKGSR